MEITILTRQLINVMNNYLLTPHGPIKIRKDISRESEKLLNSNLKKRMVQVELA